MSKKNSLDRLVLVLNASYEAISICSAKHAFTLLFKGSAVVEEVSKHTVHTQKLDIPVPDVIRLTKYRRVPRQTRSVSRKGILLRDGFRCQYCGESFPVGDLTMDHVIPRTRGGDNSWFNLVSSCKPCNQRKSDRTPEEAKMPLIKKPTQLSRHAKHRLLMASENVWDKYIF